MRRNGPYQIISSRVVYKNKWIKVREDKVIHPKNSGIFGIIDMGNGVAIVAMDKDNNVYLNREYFYAIKQKALALPSGGIDRGESPLMAAKRELLEETGLVSDKWVALGLVQPSLRIINSKQYLFLAREAKWIGSENMDMVERVKVPFEEALLMVVDGRIDHAPSCVALLKAREIVG